MMQALIIIASVGLLGAAFKSKKITELETLNSIAASVYSQYSDIAQAYTSSNVTLEDILAIICQESGTYVLNGKTNSQLVGDNNQAFGLMQIHQIAITQINSIYDKDFNIADISNDARKNIEAGSLYLQYCFLMSDNNRSKAYAMYNGGSQSYAINVMNFFQILGGKN